MSQQKLCTVESHQCPWNTKFVFRSPLFPCPSTSKLHALRCYWSTARGNAEKVHFQIFHSLIFRKLPEALGWELLFTHHPSPPLKLCIAIKWFSWKDSRWPQEWKVPLESISYRKLSSTRSEESMPMSSIMSMSSMVSSSLLMKVELLEPVSMALSSEVCELEEEKSRKSWYKPSRPWWCF